MSNGQSILNKVTVLRHHLEQAAGFATAASARGGEATQRLNRLECQVSAGGQQTVLLDATLRQLGEEGPALDSMVYPSQLTARARRILERGQDFLTQLRYLAEQIAQFTEAENTPLRKLYQATLSMTEVALRLVQVFPGAASVQLRLCEGIEAILDEVAGRLAQLTETVASRLQENECVEALAQKLLTLVAGNPVHWQELAPLAEHVLAQAAQGAPLLFPLFELDQPAHRVAQRGLTRARVTARMIRHDSDFRKNPLAAVFAALLLDVGMLQVPPELFDLTTPLQDTQRRALERHVHSGAELLAHLQGGGAWLMEAVAQHHERQDGTGYPAGLCGAQLAPLARLLAVADVYAALASPRPQRAALDTRTALAEVLILAEQGKLDKIFTERLLQLSFYPVGTAVELVDGSAAVVIATHLGRRDVTTPSRPVIAVLTDPDGRRLAAPRYVDLAQCDDSGIVRSLPSLERQCLIP